MSFIILFLAAILGYILGGPLSALLVLGLGFVLIWPMLGAGVLLLVAALYFIDTSEDKTKYETPANQTKEALIKKYKESEKHALLLREVAALKKEITFNDTFSYDESLAIDAVLNDVVGTIFSEEDLPSAVELHKDVEKYKSKLIDIKNNGYPGLAKASDISSACGTVAGTYKAKELAGSIMSRIPSINVKNALILAEKGISGYGECMCVLYNFTEFKDDMSIGYCVGEEYVNCNESNGGAFCGRKLKEHE